MTTAIALSRPLATHAGEIRALKLSEPTGEMYLRLGEPIVYGRSPDGSVFAIENEEIIRRYIEACMPPEVDAVMIGQLSLEDAMAVKEEVLDFFRAARARHSAKSSTSSSLTPA